MNAVTTDASAGSSAQRWRIFAVIMLPYVFYAFCWNTENFLRPYLAESLGLNKEQVAAFYTLQALGALLGAVILSQVADRFSRKFTYAGLSIGFGIAALGSLWVTDYGSALLQRFIMGFFMGGVFGCAVSLYVGVFSPRMRGLLSGLVQLVYNGGDALLSWTGRSYGADNWRDVMMIGGVGAIAAGVVVLLSVPRGTKNTAVAVATLPVAGGTSPSAPPRASILELFAHGRWTLTVRLAILCGLNFFAFQAFNGWLTTYLRELHSYTPDLVGKLLTVLHVGSMIGALVWGACADRFGRRANALGFALAAVFIVLYLSLPPSPVMFAVVGFAYGFCLVASGVWGPYFAELYPEHLRATAASIFHWGRIVSLFGALLTGTIAENYGLSTIMYLGAATFFVAAVFWWSLPETLEKRA
jgi:MFS family permease